MLQFKIYSQEWQRCDRRIDDCGQVEVSGRQDSKQEAMVVSRVLGLLLLIKTLIRIINPTDLVTLYNTRKIK
jgi:hypothetical protein